MLFSTLTGSLPAWARKVGGVCEVTRISGARARASDRVSVITAQGTDGPAGATANALSSLSLVPPTVLVCFDKSSRTLHAVRESERFAVNMLGAAQEGVARLFATKREQEEKFAAADFTASG